RGRERAWAPTSRPTRSHRRRSGRTRRAPRCPSRRAHAADGIRGWGLPRFVFLREIRSGGAPGSGLVEQAWRRGAVVVGAREILGRVLLDVLVLDGRLVGTRDRGPHPGRDRAGCVLEGHDVTLDTRHGADQARGRDDLLAGFERVLELDLLHLLAPRLPRGEEH